MKLDLGISDSYSCPLPGAANEEEKP